MKYRVSLIVLIIIMSCSSIDNSIDKARDAGYDLVDHLEENADTIGANFAGGAAQSLRDTLTNTKTQVQLDSLITVLGENFSSQVAAARDSLFNEKTREWLRETLKDDILGDTTLLRVVILRDELLGSKTKHLLNEVIASNATLLRDILLGDSTRAAIDTIVSSGVTKFSERYAEKLSPLLKDEVKSLKKTINSILIIGGIIIVVILFVIWFLFKRGQQYQEMLGLITCRIHEIPDQSAYDDLVRGIRRRSQEAGYEPRLRQILEKHGILGPESWQPAK